MHLMEFSSGSSGENSARPFCLKGADRGQVPLQAVILVTSSEGAIIPSGRLAKRAFFTPQAIEHGVNTLLGRRSLIGPCEILSNDFVQFLQ